MNGPEGCPECGSLECDLEVVRFDRLVKRCASCRHVWNEEREPELIREGGYVARDAEREGRRLWERFTRARSRSAYRAPQ